MIKGNTLVYTLFDTSIIVNLCSIPPTSAATQVFMTLLKASSKSLQTMSSRIIPYTQSVLKSQASSSSAVLSKLSDSELECSLSEKRKCVSETTASAKVLEPILQARVFNTDLLSVFLNLQDLSVVFQALLSW